ncbi:MAG: putative aminohydrolase SsnA [Calditrichaeota bacterium]|nr:MAG: putative aminohydrolase SsnA [Calditrichota bacterium]
MNLLIHNATIFTNDDDNTILQDVSLVIEGNRIIEVGPRLELVERYRDYRRINAAGKLVMPGLINTHNHFYSTFARGLSLPVTPRNFHEILKFLWWKLDKALDLEAVYYSALVMALGAVKGGVTAVIDHHASPNAVEGSLDQIEEALSLVGLRGILCYEISDRDGIEVRKEGLLENERFARKCELERQEDPDYPFDAMVGLHASFTLEDETLELAAELSNTLGKGCHIHLLEDQVDQRITREKYEYGVVARLLKFGILGEKSLTAHGIYLNEQGMGILADTGTMLAHNPRSNMNNAVGRADIFAMLDQGILVGLGSDGMSGSITPDILTAYLLHKHDLKNPNVGWSEIEELALKNNPEIFLRISGQKVGKIIPGYLADVIIVDYYPPTPMTSENFWGHVLFGILEAPVDTSIINGRLVMENKIFPDIDEEEIAAEAHMVAQEVWRRFYENS